MSGRWAWLAAGVALGVGIPAPPAELAAWWSPGAALGAAVVFVAVYAAATLLRGRHGHSLSDTLAYQVDLWCGA